MRKAWHDHHTRARLGDQTFVDAPIGPAMRRLTVPAKVAVAVLASVAMILSAVAGGLLTLIGRWVLDRRDTRKQKKS